jgi:hypothetical protein
MQGMSAYAAGQIQASVGDGQKFFQRLSTVHRGELLTVLFKLLLLISPSCSALLHQRRHFQTTDKEKFTALNSRPPHQSHETLLQKVRNDNSPITPSPSELSLHDALRLEDEGRRLAGGSLASADAHASQHMLAALKMLLPSV